MSRPLAGIEGIKPSTNHERITAPVIRCVLMGEEQELRFDNRAAMLAERYWREELGQRVSYLFILAELDAGTLAGIAATAWGAAASAAMHRNRTRQQPEPITSSADFSRLVRVEELTAARAAIREAVIETLPAPQKNAQGGGSGD